ncbi:MAG: type II toxin-antitoxin system HipA family toxin [Crocinitomicaceae bacterium]
MITTAFVKIWDELVGAIAWDVQGQFGSFEYDAKFIQKGWDLAPIIMPIAYGSNIYNFPYMRANKNSPYDTFKGLPGLIADSLPDRYGNQLINLWLARQGRPVNSMNPIEQLCFIGTRGMGALEFEPQQIKSRQNTFNVEVESLVGIAREMLSERQNFHVNVNKEEAQAIQQLITLGTSAGGARPKAVIAYNPKTGEVRSGQSIVPKNFEHWLIKLDGVSDIQLGDSVGYGRLEMAYYLMARDAGIEMMPSQLLEENGRAHFMTKRFDRDQGNVKHHTQTFCAMRHYDFNEINSYSYEQLFQVMRELGLDYADAEQMFRRMVFNVLARNCDDHTKNFSFLLKKDQNWELAPAYDICHAYRPDSYWLSQHALSINGKRKNIKKEDLLTIASESSVKKAKNIIKDIQAIISQWPDYAKMVQVDQQKIIAIQTTLKEINL